MIALIALLAAATAVPAPGGPSLAATKAFDGHVAKVEERIRREESSIWTFDTVSDEDAKGFARGKAVVKPGGTAVTDTADVPGGTIHDWCGKVFLPGVRIPDVLAVLQDYEHSAKYYAPEVMTSKLVSRDGDEFHIEMRLRERQMITVVMDTEYEVKYGRLDAEHQFSFSRSTRIAEIADAGGTHEHALSDTENHGYLWRLNSYWRFSQVSDGVVIDCEAVSLTRNVPAGLGWLVGPFVRELPRESLEKALEATRDAVPAQEHGFWLWPPGFGEDGQKRAKEK